MFEVEGGEGGGWPNVIGAPISDSREVGREEGIDLQLNRLLINEEHGCSKREQGRLYRMYICEYTRVLQRCCTQGLGACSQLINGWAESQPVKLEGVSFVLAPIISCACVCVWARVYGRQGWTKVVHTRACLPGCQFGTIWRL